MGSIHWDNPEQITIEWTKEKPKGVESQRISGDIMDDEYVLYRFLQLILTSYLSLAMHSHSQTALGGNGMVVMNTTLCVLSSTFDLGTAITEHYAQTGTF